MTSTETQQARRGVAMVGPPYLYNGAQVCGRRTSRTCIFLLASFGPALSLIGLVFLTADLRMESGLWAAGAAFILLGVVLLVWFLTLCCSARRTFRDLPASHPARAKPTRAVLTPPRTASTYQLLPLTPTRTQVTHASHMTVTRTLPFSTTSPSLNSSLSRTIEPDGYPTWGYGRREKDYTPEHDELEAAVYAWGYSPGHTRNYQGLGSYLPDCTMTEYHMSDPLTAHTLGRPSPGLQRGRYTAGYSMTLPSTHTSPAAHVGGDRPPPYHTIVSGP